MSASRQWAPATRSRAPNQERRFGGGSGAGPRDGIIIG
jgi:hypothetical protein